MRSNSQDTHIWALGCVNCRPAATESKEARFTQPRAHLIALLSRGQIQLQIYQSQEILKHSKRASVGIETGKRTTCSATYYFFILIFLSNTIVA